MPETFIDELEAVVEEVAERAAREIQEIVDTLAPDGRPFGQDRKSLEEQLIEYRNIRNDTAAWKLWISNKALEITGKLQVDGIDQEKINALNPLRIAIAFMVDYSTRMEKELQERMI